MKKLFTKGTIGWVQENVSRIQMHKHFVFVSVPFSWKMPNFSSLFGFSTYTLKRPEKKDYKNIFFFLFHFAIQASIFFLGNLHKSKLSISQFTENVMFQWRVASLSNFSGHSIFTMMETKMVHFDLFDNILYLT